MSSWNLVICDICGNYHLHEETGKCDVCGKVVCINCCDIYEDGSVICDYCRGD